MVPLPPLTVHCCLLLLAVAYLSRDMIRMERHSLDRCLSTDLGIKTLTSSKVFLQPVTHQFSTCGKR